VEFLDAPVSGGEPKPSTPRWLLWWAGPCGFHQARADSSHMGGSVTLTGPVGAGNMTKLANQIIVACKHRRDGRSAGVGHQSRPRPGSGFQRHQGVWQAARC